MHPCGGHKRAAQFPTPAPIDVIHIKASPLPGKRAVLIEAAPSSQGERGGFWVRFVKGGDASGPVREYPEKIH
jgi:hypothetical protein